MIPGYSVIESLKEDCSWRLLRCMRAEDNRPVLIKTARSRTPDPVLAQQLEAEFGILSDLNNLAYIAPEQTGRIEADIDYRTDLYSLDVMFYEMLTGKPPFDTEDPLELIHCHLARIPKHSCDIDADIPRPLSDIAMRLLMKKADERYKSPGCAGRSAGMRRALPRCRRDEAGIGDRKNSGNDHVHNARR